MTQLVLQLSKEQKTASMESIQKFLSENYEAFVLVTCSKPSQEGEMQAEMFYEGGEDLTAYLIDKAQAIIMSDSGDQNENSSESL
jgi:hypothetical protein